MLAFSSHIWHFLQSAGVPRQKIPCKKGLVFYLTRISLFSCSLEIYRSPGCSDRKSLSSANEGVLQPWKSERNGSMGGFH